MAAALTPVHDAALDAYRRGWSVIPLIGGDDAARGKAPTMAWAAYQQQLPALADLHRWFVRGAASAYGIVCGRISRLLVIDFDDPAAAADFERTFPELLDTYTVRSGGRGTPHLYFQVDVPIASQKLRGGDLKAEGGYVVGAASTIAGRTWTVARGCPPKPLTLAQIRAVIAHFRPHSNEAPSAPSRPVGTVTAAEVIRQYQQAARTGQRNNSLFRLALDLRDRGLPQTWTVTTLAEVHAHCLEPGEDPARRRREAERTIASAYRRPSGRRLERVARRPVSDGIDNGLREALLKLPDGTAFLRVYEGLRLSGMRPDDTFTHAEARQRLGGLVGDHSIRRALAMTIGQSADTGQDKAKRCFVPQPEPTINRRGRPRIHYRMPAADDLRRALGLAATVSDPITADDLRSVRAYRAALEREFIRRCPGQYPQRWLADRLGVSNRSIHRYHADVGIITTPCFETTPITWANATTIPPNAVVAKRAGLRPGGRFLEDEDGKRYPSKPGIAMRLLGRGKQVVLRERTFSRYQVGSMVAD